MTIKAKGVSSIHCQQNLNHSHGANPRHASNSLVHGDAVQDGAVC